jgi:hypothetical protein
MEQAIFMPDKDKRHVCIKRDCPAIYLFVFFLSQLLSVPASLSFRQVHGREAGTREILYFLENFPHLKM